MIRSITPGSEILKKYIVSFSISVHADQYPLRYMAYPQLGTSLGLFNNAGVRIEKNHITFTPQPYTPPVAVLLGRITAPTFVTFNGYIDEISINFSPAGINYFFDIPYLELAPLPHQLIHRPSWNTFLTILFSHSEENRITCLEAFLLSLIKSKANNLLLSYIETSIQETPAIKVSELSRKTCMSERNFLRFFKAHFGCAPSTYLKICRFRNVINADNFEAASARLKDLYLANCYYDYTHFKKDFLDLTKQRPPDFFNTISFLGNKKHTFRLS